jgi:hypothetical protein
MGLGPKDDFTNWLASIYPNFSRREWTISNYLTDGEDWLRRLIYHYPDTDKG